MAPATCATWPHPPPPPYPTAPKKRRFGTPRLRAITFSAVVWMLHLTMPSMSVARSPESSSACTDASSAETCSGLPMFFENGSCPTPTTAALLLSDTRGFLATGWSAHQTLARRSQEGRRHGAAAVDASGQE